MQGLTTWVLLESLLNTLSKKNSLWSKPFTLTVFKLFLFKRRLVQWLAQQVAQLELTECLLF